MLTVNQELQGGRYRILNQFGSEDLGASYQAFDNVLQTKVIIKETFADNPGLYKNTITRQMESLSSIRHESFTQVHGYFSEVDRQYLVTESAEGKSLKDLLEKNQKPFLLSDVLFWVEQALNALNYLHSKIPPIIHCGITPNNLILVENKKIKLLTSAIIKDFGSKPSGKQKDQFSDLKLPYLSLELLWETLDPASQKVILNSYSIESAEILESPVDERSSVYALGATVYHLITGKVPVNALERSIEILDGKSDPLVDPSSLNTQIPHNFSAFLLKSLELKRENRFASISDMRISLQPMLDLMKKNEAEKQREASNQAVREAALREVELARQALKKQREEEAEAEWKQILSAIEQAAKTCNQFRIREGEVVKQIFKDCITAIAERLDKVKEQDVLRIPAVRERLRKSVTDLLQDESFDQNRFEQELIYYIERFDISEEKVRLATHLSYFIEVLEKEGSGKKLNFISQEIGREINTIGSKANDALIQRYVVEMKDELEKIKEQTANVL